MLIAGGLNGCCQLFKESILIRRERSLGQGTIQKEVPLSQIGSIALFKPAGFSTGYFRFTHKEMDPDSDESTVIFIHQESTSPVREARISSAGAPRSNRLSPGIHDFGSLITVITLKVESPTRITATITIASNAVLGLRSEPHAVSVEAGHERLMFQRGATETR